MNNIGLMRKQNYQNNRNFSIIKLLAIIIVFLILYVGMTNFFNDKKIEKLRSQIKDSRTIDNGDGTRSTSIAQAMEDNLIKVKSISENNGKVIVHEDSLQNLKGKKLSFTHTMDLKWGGKASAEIESDIHLQYMYNLNKFKFSPLKSGAVYIEIPRKSLECKAIIEDEQIVSKNLSLWGATEQLFDFKKTDFEVEVLNSAKEDTRKQAKAAGNNTLSDADVLQIVQENAIDIIQGIYKASGVKTYISFE